MHVARKLLDSPPPYARISNELYEATTKASNDVQNLAELMTNLTTSVGNLVQQVDGPSFHATVPKGDDFSKVPSHKGGHTSNTSYGVGYGRDGM
eukprot:CAMPEP_0178900562 /NCGR_PEP_ID=MMETSP0786-20121207/3540_1 /TAXON_ID=186022 /ORGANISM="Thalassionema frauenfeldii, Strain CCMP 1798" /LENGTH=93 /DNA_ID=CAMNT_0020571575 /DNA_START=995 /DNA_END=1277 /DNA_ORIENTATION=+